MTRTLQRRDVRRVFLRALALAWSVVMLFACGGGDDAASSSGDTRIAFLPDFQGFRTWEAFHLADDGASDIVHLRGPKAEYLNQRPPKGSTAFPVGTIVVKELETGPVGTRKVFAMVKRGGGYNAAGAPGWEWFELENADDGSVKRIVWRGLGPPNGEQYGGDPNGCTSCHAQAKDNDYVPSPALRLGSL